MVHFPPQLKALLDAARHKHVDKNQVLLYQGDSVNEVLYLAEGVIKMYDIDDAGNEKILHIFKSPAFVPLALFSNRDVVTRWFYASLTECDVAAVNRDELDELYQRDPETAAYLMHWYSREVHEILTRLNSLSKTLARDKIIAALKHFATFHVHATRGRWYNVTFPVTHQFLADFTGVSRESTTACLHDLQAEKLIKMPAQSTLQINRNKLFKD